MTIEISIGREPWHRAAALYIRYQVFVIEKRIAREDEFDAFDNDNRLYAIALEDNQPVATARYLVDEDGSVRLTRIATLKEHRGKGYGEKVVLALEAYAKSQGINRLVIHSELSAKSFYERLGYTAFSEVYEEDGEPCQSLEKII